LTGEPDEVYRVIRDGFKVAVEENPDPKTIPGELVIHTNRLAVLDKTGAVRGYYDSADPSAQELIKRKVASLEKEESP
ncbi:MAG: hypothetical protein ACRDD1_10780, partial [Planctomycetia bacterium]